MFKPLTSMHSLFIPCVIVSLFAISAWSQVNTQLNTLTGNQRTRIVWMEGGHTLKGGGVLRGYDSQTDSIKQILPAALFQNKPIICSGGYRVVVTRQFQTCVVNWDGTGLRTVASGICSDVWIDPATGLEWAIVRKGDTTSAGPVYRYLIDDPTQSKLMWNRTPAGDWYMNWYQLSADGKVGVDFLPWDRAFVVDSGAYATNGFETGLSRGCWSSLASDNSYYWFNLPLTGLGHKAFNVFKYKDTVKTQLPLNFINPTTTSECYHPRFASNGGRYLVLTGDWTTAGTNSSAIEVYLGKFNAAYTGFDGWVRITSNSLADFTPDAWVGVVAPSPSMRFSADSLAFSAVQGGGSPAAKADTVTTPNGALVSVTATDNAVWLSTAVVQAGGGWVVTATPDISGLASGVYRAVVTVNSSVAVPALRTFLVKLTITGTPVASSIVVSPANNMIVKSGTGTYTATVYDQMERVMSPQPVVTWSIVSATGGCTVAGGVVTAGTTTGLYNIMASSGALRDTATVNVVEFIPVHLKINCGDDSPGYVPGWSGDGQYLVAGHTAGNFLDDQGQAIDLSAVVNPPPRDVYVKFRSGAVWYSFPSSSVPAGSYRVRLHYNEQYNDNLPRSLSCSMEGKPVMTNMNILTEAGGVKNKAVVKEYDVTVNNDGLQMQFSGNGVIGQGLEIISSGSLAKQLTLLSPLGGQVYQVGQALDIIWSGNPNVSGVALEMSTDDGVSWNLIVGNTIGVTDPLWGAYRWVIPAMLTFGTQSVSTVSDQVLIRVRKYTEPAVYDVSPSPMTIVASSASANRIKRIGTIQKPSVRWTRDGVTTFIPWQGIHTVELFGLDGRRVATLKSDATSNRTIKVAPGSVIMRVKGSGKTQIQKTTGVR